ncbi:MAG TPA: phospholipase C, phosphocholine-specific [Lacipirellulaceae bacterium]|nr:phospholipase C, phosphocholine-specific [Lacipirellulaceae bacterium]
METRRQFLMKSALAGGSGLAGNLFGSIQRALAIEPEHNSTFWDAEHVVILMQENRSFDHAFGMLRGVRGYNDPRAITLPDGNLVWVQTNSAGESYAPFRLNIKDSNSTWLGCLPHGWTDQVDARNNGRHDRWLDVKRSGEGQYSHLPLTLGYYNRDDIPFYYALADAFTICDQHFCSSLTGTTPNRCYLWSGTIRAQQDAKSPANVLNSDADHVTNVTWPTFPERLEDLGVSWKIYQNDLDVGVGFTEEEAAWLGNFGDNPLEYFSQFKVRLTPEHRNYLETRAKSLPIEIEALQRGTAPSPAGADSTDAADLIKEKVNLLNQIKREREKWNQSNYDRLTAREKSLLAKAFCTNAGDPDSHALSEISYRDGEQERKVAVPKGDLLHQFRKDVTEGTLPTVSWIVPPERFSDHPGSAWYGAWYIAEVLDILTKNPALWKKTVFILTYDENDGYFDHVPPFVAPDPRRPETGRVSKNIDAALEYVTRESEMKRKSARHSRDSSIGLGYRVPLIVASPWSRGGYVCSQVFDHTSPLQFLERLLSKKLGQEVREANITEWRRTVCGDLTSTFQAVPSGNAGSVRFPTRNEFIEQIHRAQFKSLPAGIKRLSTAEIDQIRRRATLPSVIPQQEPGVRPACGIPYELFADGKLSADRREFTIAMEASQKLFGDRAAGAPFKVYAHHKAGELRTRDYAIAAGDRLDDSWPLDGFADGRYKLAAYGPNGFYRAFEGDSRDPLLEITCKRDDANPPAHPSHRLAIALTNRDNRPYTVKIQDEAYKNKSQQASLAPSASTTFTIDCERSFGWYDFSLIVDDCEQFSRRYAGRIENGKPSYSDPAMGRVM